MSEAPPTRASNSNVAVRSLGWTVEAVGCAALVAALVAYWQLGGAGVVLVVVLSGVVLASCWVANAIESRWTRRGRDVAGPLAASGVRAAVPLVGVMIVLVTCSRWLPPASVLLVLPLYLSALVMETIRHARRATIDTARTAWASPNGRSLASPGRGQG